MKSILWRQIQENRAKAIAGNDYYRRSWRWSLYRLRQLRLAGDHPCAVSGHSYTSRDDHGYYCENCGEGQ